MLIREFKHSDAEEVSSLIVKTLRTSNAKDYSADHIENDVNASQPKDIIKRAKWTHFYVVEKGERIVGCGATGPYWGRQDESSLYTIFVLPEYQDRGIGREIIQKL